MKASKNAKIKILGLILLCGLLASCTQGTKLTGQLSSSQSSSSVGGPSPTQTPSPVSIPLLPPTGALGYNVQTLIDDMGPKNDGVLGDNLGGATQAGITMGLMRGDAAAAWIATVSPQALALTVSDVYWNKFNEWFVLVGEKGNQDGSSYVEFRNDVTYLLYKSNNQWKAVDTPEDETWSYNANGLKVSQKTQSDGHLSFLIPGNKTDHIHGGAHGGVKEVNPADVLAIHHRLEARLVIDPSGYNPNYTNRLMNIGIDLIPPNGLGISYLPGCGGSRFKRLTPNWQVFTFTTVRPNSNPSVVETPVNRSLKTYLTEDELRVNPPPGF